MSTRIGPHDQLLIGTKVQVGNEIGYIIGVEVVQSSNNRGTRGDIVLHTIEFIEKRRYLYGSKYKVESIKPKRRKVNYSFINVL